MYVVFVLRFRVVVATHSRRSPRFGDVQTCQPSDVLTSLTPKSLPLNLFADPHPLNPVASIFTKTEGQEGPYSPPVVPLYRYVASAYLLCLPLLRKLPGVYPKFPFWNSPLHAFVRTVTCPEGVHRTYYWNRRASPPSFPQATVRRLRLRGGCDG